MRRSEYNKKINNNNNNNNNNKKKKKKKNNNNNNNNNNKNKTFVGSLGSFRELVNVGQEIRNQVAIVCS